MSKRYKMLGVLGVLCVILCWPGVAFANAGTPLMWMGLFRLFFINILIGIGEATILVFVFRCYQKGDKSLIKAMGVMALANYFSMIVGEVFILPYVKEHARVLLGEVPLYGAWDFLKVMLAAVIAITVVLEWPFCLWVLRKKKHAFWKSLIASPMVHVGSYAVLISIYFSVSGLGVYTELEIDKSMSFVKNPEAWVYYISVDDGDVYRIHPDGTGEEKYFEAGVEIDNSEYHISPFLFVWPREKKDGWNLWISDPMDTEKDCSMLVKNFSKNSAQTKCIWYAQEQEYKENPEDMHMYGYDWIDRATDLRGENKSGWKIRTGFWAVEGLEANNENTGQSLRVSFETPFLAWLPRSATILPGDQVVFQLGEQIVLVDLNERKIGFIVMGQGPVVALD